MSAVMRFAWLGPLGLVTHCFRRADAGEQPWRRDQAHRALQKALDAAGIEMPYPTQSLHLHDESDVTKGRS
jgi:small-conductance mechanosensitive channel